MTKQRGRAKYRLTVKLDLEWDADGMGWLMKYPRGQRSTAVRDAIRGVISPEQATDIEAFRAVIAEELANALAGQHLMSMTAEPPIEESQIDMETKFGSKLDRMLGGLMKPGTDAGKENEAG